jgi:hypothetical protein
MSQSRHDIVKRYGAMATMVKNILKTGTVDRELTFDEPIIFDRSPPSVAAFSTLKKIYIDDLRLRTVHRGTYLLLRTITSPLRLFAVSSVVEDENGGCTLMQAYNQDGRRNPDDILPLGKVVVVKEPFFRATGSGDASIRVDHVSDIEFLDDDDERVPIQWQSKSNMLARTAMEWKTDGNKYFGQKKYFEASEWYEAFSGNLIFYRVLMYSILVTPKASGRAKWGMRSTRH